MASLSGGFCFCFSLVVVIAIFSGNTVAAVTEFDFPSLSLSSVKLLGDAHLSNGSFRLTRDLDVPSSSAGRVLYSKPIRFRRPEMRSPASFSTFFSFSIANLNPSSIGGGLAFVLSADDEYIGDAGGFLGITDAVAGKRRNVVAVEFDTLMDVEFRDINGNHVGLDLNSLISFRVGDLDAVGVDLKSSNLINSWIHYSGSNRTVQVYVSYSNLKPSKPIISADLDLDDYIPDDFMFVGFSGSTQGSTETHSIDWWSFSSAFDEPMPSPAPPTASLTNATAAATVSPPPMSAPPPANTSDDKCGNELCRNSPGAIAGVVTAGAFSLAFLTGIFVWLYKKKFRDDENRSSQTVANDVVLRMPKEFSYGELKAATKGFDSSRIIGHGAYGTVYRGTLPSTGDAVAVKRCTHAAGQGRADFLSELSIIATLRHRNLVRLQGWCHDQGENLLVYDLMANGSLDKALFESTAVLPWPHRRKILLGVASALVYLHQECERQVIHRDIKTSNIMLDECFNARLGDFGLARQVEHNKSPDATVAAGTMGYLAPEYLITGRASDKTDVFSYGAVVLEVATGRRPIEKEITGGNLVEWVWGLHREGMLMAASDPKLRSQFDVAEMNRVLLVGLACSHPDPSVRPTMRGVVQMLIGEADVPSVPRAKPALSFTTSELIMTLEDNVSDLNGMIGISTSPSSSEASFSVRGGGSSRGGGGGGGLV